MTIYFSASSLGFYDDKIKSVYQKAASWPSDAVAITSADHATYIGTPPAGKVLGATAAGQPTWVAAPIVTLTLPQQAQAAFAAGLPCTSSTASALDATYPLDSNTQNEYAALMGYYGQFSEFPNGSTTVTVLDVDQKPHTFDFTQFKALFKTLGDYRYALKEVIAGNGTTPPDPSNFGTLP